MKAAFAVMRSPGVSSTVRFASRPPGVPLEVSSEC